MFPSASPQKRKHHEYHDPDYPGAAGQEEEQPTTSKRAARESNQPTTIKATNTIKPPPSDEVASVSVPSDRLVAIISREFQRETALKQQQLEQIDERLTQARHLLERLRYAIVAEYYQKQELPLTASEASALRQTTLPPSATTSAEAEHNAPQMPLHPSVKKIIGKKPRSYEELLRACPKRAAAQTAKHTIRAKSQAQRREERRLIREQGIVIDHEKQQQQQQQEQAVIKQEQPLTEVALKRLLPPPPPPQSPLVGKALNATRLNNKRKHLVVVGNTSKYIGGEGGVGAAGSLLTPSLPTLHGQQTLSHKWLVYVQAKEEATQPLQSFVKKVRFFLHASYRPNDVVDICAPPFQIARRGWGEFPMRIQLFFHERLQQKPVQLVHQLVLDKTQSGLHTLGAETLVEVWLRTEEAATSTATAAAEETKMKPTTPQKKAIETKVSSPKIETTTMHQPHHQQQQTHQTVAAVHSPTPKPRLISYTQNKEELDDNLFEFLNNIGGTPTAFCGDIEKIQPTVLVSEAEVLTHIPALLAPPQQLPLQMTTTTAAAATGATAAPIVSPRKLVAPQHVSKVQTMTLATTSAAAAAVAAANNKLENTPQTPTQAPVAAAKKLENAPQIIGAAPAATPAAAPVAKVGVFNVPLPVKAPPSTPIANFKNLRIVNNNNNNINTNNNNRKTFILQGGKSSIPVATASNGFAAPQSSQPAPKKILQKKLVQLVDADGKIKYLQMLVATTPPAAAAAASSTPANQKNTFVLPAAAAAKVLSTAASSAANSIKTVPPQTNTISKTVNLAANIIPKTNAATTPTSGIMTIAAAATKPKAPPQSNAAIFTSPSLPAVIKTMKTSQAPIPTTTTPPTLPPLKATSTVPNPTAPPRNVVFQKEGKLYIIDPQQMKLRQQQKKQFSLLKPQVSLLKPQQRPPEPTTPKSTAAAVATPKSNAVAVATPRSVVGDHSYKPAPAIFRKPLPPPAAAISAPAVHLGMRQTRVAASNAYELLQQQRQAFEQQFAAASFNEMRAAIEFLLRRMPLVLPPATTNTTSDATVAPAPSASFGWCSNTPQEFEALPALKQRSCEWLRAKYISSSLRKHKDLQQLAATKGADAFWSTREICIFARWHAYTPALKALQSPLLGGDKLKQPSPQSGAGTAPFNALVKSELESQPPLHAFETLTTQSRLRSCIDDLWQRLQQHELEASATQLIDVVGVDDSKNAKHKSAMKSTEEGRMQPLHGERPVLYLPPPEPLALAAQLVGDICREQRLRLPAETVLAADEGGGDDADAVQVVQPLAQTLLAQCLRIFVEKLLRQSLAAKVQHSAAACASSSAASSSAICTGGSELLLSRQDIGRVLAQSSDFDFLTNCHFGIVAKSGEEVPTPSSSPSKRV